MATLVHFHLWDPRERSLFKVGVNDHAKAYYVHCSLPEGWECPLRKKGQCISRTFLGEGCLYGRASTEEGPTKRAQTLSKWVRERLEKNPNAPTLSAPKDVMAVIGEYVWLPYAHMQFQRGTASLETEAFRNGTHFVKRADLTPEAVAALCDGVPLALFDGSMFGGKPGRGIPTYQKESVPKFVRHLKEVLPDLYAATLAIYPRLGEILALTSNIGREAVLSTLAPNVGQFRDIHGGEWTWDGEWLVSLNSKLSFGLVSKFSEARIKPDPRSIVKVTDEGQVTSETEFVS